jgi:DNA polymerase III delta subunit
MHYFIHGDYHMGSRNLLTSLIEQGKNGQKEVIELDGSSLDLNGLIQATQSNSLFGGEKLIVIENLFSRLKSKEQEEMLKWLKTYDNSNDIVFWEKKSIGKILQRNLPKNTTVKEFKTPAIIFKIVETLSPANKKQALNLLESILEKEPAEFVFAMVVRQIRMLLLIAGGETVGGAPWMVGKMKKQASSFSLEKLTERYQKLYEIDKEIKTGKGVMPLAWHLKLWVSEL